MAEPSVDPSQLGAAIITLVTIAGPTVIGSLFILWLGYRARSRLEAGEHGGRPMLLSSLYADSAAVESVGRSLSRLATAHEVAADDRRDRTRAVEEQTRAIEDLTRALREHQRHK